MAALFLLFSTSLSLLALQAAAGGYGGWQSAHATFYGGGDASGTMGKSYSLACCSVRFTQQPFALLFFLIWWTTHVQAALAGTATCTAAGTARTRRR
jgi:hypothetical protein